MDKKVANIIESLLFVWGEPLDIKNISNIVDLSLADTRKVLDEMIEEFENNRGLIIYRMGNKYQLMTREEYFPWIKELGRKTKRKLSNAAIETLSIIAYKQPITRVEIEDIRGVKSDKVIDSLLARGLIKEAGTLDKPGRPIIYKTTDEFLNFLSIKSLKELPDIEDFAEKEKEG